MYNGEGAWDGRQALADCREDWLADVARFGAEPFLPCCIWLLCVSCASLLLCAEIVEESDS